MKIFLFLVGIAIVYYVFFRKQNISKKQERVDKKDVEVGKTVIIKKEPNPTKINIDAEETDFEEIK